MTDSNKNWNQSISKQYKEIRMREDKIEEVVFDLKKNASAMQRNASGFFVLAILVLIGAGIIFYKLTLPNPGPSTGQFALQMTFTLLSRLALIVISFYLVRLLMSVVSYNLALSNDLDSKANSLLLFKSNGSLSLNELKEHLNVNNHLFEASKSFSGKNEMKTLINMLKASK